jgi:hypothetical protein
MSESLLSRAWYEYEFARVMGRVTVSMTLGQPGNERHVEALAATEASLAVLADSSVPKPDDLGEVTGARMTELESNYRAQYDSAQEVLALPAEQQAALGLSGVVAQQAATVAVSWIVAIAAVKQEEGL